jgi:hypothetical protein
MKATDPLDHLHETTVVAANNNLWIANGIFLWLSITTYSYLLQLILNDIFLFLH